MNIVRYWWTEDGDEELCYLNREILQEDVHCEHCYRLMVAGENVYGLTPLRKIAYDYDESVQPDKYILCSSCIAKSIEEVSKYKGISYEELLRLLKTVETVEELNSWRYEIGARIPSVYMMFGYNQQNSYHQYDLWEHSLHTVINLPRNLDDDMLYLAALLHDIGKPECQCKSGREEDTNMHYYGHPIKSMEIVRDEVIPCLEAAGVELSEDDKKRLLYYVEYHDYRMSHREKHLKKHLSMVPVEWFKGLMLLQVADAKAHVQIPIIEERERICTDWYNRVSASE